MLAVLAVGWWTGSRSSGPPRTTDVRGEQSGGRVAGTAVPARSHTSPEQAAIASLVQEALAEAQQLTARYVPEPQLFADWPVTEHLAAPLPLAA